MALVIGRFSGAVDAPPVRIRCRVQRPVSSPVRCDGCVCAQSVRSDLAGWSVLGRYRDDAGTRPRARMIAKSECKHTLRLIQPGVPILVRVATDRRCKTARVNMPKHMLQRRQPPSGCSSTGGVASYALMKYKGRPFDSLKSRPKYSPITPIESSCTPPRNSITAIRDG